MVLDAQAGSAQRSLQKVIGSLSRSSNKYFEGISVETFNIFHSVQNTMFLYWLSHELFLSGHVGLAAKVYYLNKMLNCVELFYEVELPDIWFCEHPLGSVMGRARYGNHFFFGQGCTVGQNHGIYPIIGEHVSMLSDSKIIGRSTIGDHCVISANTYIKDENIPSHSVVFGQSPNLIVKPYHNAETNWKE